MQPSMVHPSEGGTHWYDRSGKPTYEVLARNGQPRPTTLADARKMDLVPSVTAIIRCAAAPGLVNWQIDQGILAALTLPRSEAEAEADWLARVKQDAQEQARAAAERGTAIHALIESWYSREDTHVPAGMFGVIAAVTAAIADTFGAYREWMAECSFADPLGFGGKADLVRVDGGVLLDFKTKDAWEEGARLAWDEHAIQLAAYRQGLIWSGRLHGAAECGNVFVSRTPPWQVHIHRWEEADLQRGWAMFASLLAYWKAKNNFDPAWTEEGAA